MARRGRGEIGKVDFRPAMGASPKASSMRRNPSLGVVQKDDAATSSPAAGASNSNQAMRPLSPGRHFSFPNKAGGFGGSDDEEEAAQAFDAALVSRNLSSSFIQIWFKLMIIPFIQGGCYLQRILLPLQPNNTYSQLTQLSVYHPKTHRLLPISGCGLKEAQRSTVHMLVAPRYDHQ